MASFASLAMSGWSALQFPEVGAALRLYTLLLQAKITITKAAQAKPRLPPLQAGRRAERQEHKEYRLQPCATSTSKEGLEVYFISVDICHHAKVLLLGQTVEGKAPK